MVCNRCIKVVNEELLKMGLQVQKIELGKVELLNEPDTQQLSTIKVLLTNNGFDLIDDKKIKTIERIKTLIINAVHYNYEGKTVKSNYSDYISGNIGMDYSYLSALFSSCENTTIEKYTILQKVERVKELVVYNELTLSEIADQMGYSSVQHLSSQFKKITGLTPSHFRQIPKNSRKPIDKI